MRARRSAAASGDTLISMSENLVSPEATTAANTSPWAPLRYPTFRMLWLVWLASNTCMWMNDVAAAWLMTTLTTSPTLIALVQTASSLPVFLLGLPSGAFADILDRRRYFMVTQIWVATNAAVLCAVAIAGHLTAPILLLLVFTNGIGLAMRWPVYAAILPEVIDRAHLGDALALNAVAVNTSRVAAHALRAGAHEHVLPPLHRALRSAAAGGQALRRRRRAHLHAAPRFARRGGDHGRHPAAARAGALEPRRDRGGRVDPQCLRHRRPRLRAQSMDRGAGDAPLGCGLDLRGQLGDDRGAPGAPRLGAGARHVDLPDVDHGRRGARRGDLGEARRAHQRAHQPRRMRGEHARRPRRHSRRHARGLRGPHADASVRRARAGHSHRPRRGAGDGHHRVPGRSGAHRRIRGDHGRKPRVATAGGRGVVGALRGPRASGALR